MKEFKIMDDYKLNLHTYLWETKVKPLGVVQIVHGANEHSFRYDEFAKFLTDKGYIVIANDHRGHGKTRNRADEDLTHFDKKDGHKKLINGVEKVTDYIKVKYPNLPIFLFGHSMGSFISRYLISKNSSNYKGVILSGTGFNNPYISHFGLYLSSTIKAVKGDRYFSKVMDDITFGQLPKHFEKNENYHERDWLTTDKKMIDKFDQDELFKGRFSIASQVSLFKLLVKIDKKSYIRKIRKDLPIFLISGDDDPVGNFGSGVLKLYKIMKELGLKVDYKLYKNGRHEMINEVNRDQVYEDVFQWINNKI